MRYVIIILIVLAVPALAHPATLKVPSQYPKIQGAIDASVNGDTVLVAPGTYVENIDFLGKAITVTSSGGAGVTVIDGGQPAHYYYGSVVTFDSGEGLDSVLDGFTLTNGRGGTFFQAGIPGGYGGGGIFCDNSSPTITNNVISGNTAGNTVLCFGLGGGVYCHNASPTITNNTITGNIVIEPGAGSWYAHGGGIWCGHSSSPTITNNIITANSATEGGGGISCHYNSSPTITNNAIFRNTADDHGGGIYCDGPSTTITNNIISGNTTNIGGGIICGGSSSTIINNTISGNTAYDYGGGIICGSYTNNLTIMNNTIMGNTANNDGGGIYCGFNSFPTVTNTILWNNYADEGPEIWVEGYAAYPSTLTISYSDVKGGKSSVYVDPNSTLNWGAGMIDADPLFVAGPCGFLYLSQIAPGQAVDSPCVDTGAGPASNYGMDIYWTRTDGTPDSGTVDMGFHYGDFLFPTLQTDTFMIPESTGGDADFLLLAGSVNANRNYILLGSVTGTDPGTPLPGGMTTLPLNWDVFTNLVVDLINTPICSNFMGTLNSSGSATATFDTLAPIPGSAGITLHFAYALNNPWDFASNPVGIEIVP